MSEGAGTTGTVGTSHVGTRLAEQTLDALALAYGLAHGAALSQRLDTAHASLLLAMLLGATCAFLAQAERYEQKAGVNVTSMAGTPRTWRQGVWTGGAQIVLWLQRYALYAFAYLARVQVGALFGAKLFSVEALATPLLACALLGTLLAVLQRHNLVPPTTGLRSPLAFTERFVEAVAFTAGLTGAPPWHQLNSVLAFGALLAGSILARQFVDQHQRTAWAAYLWTAVYFVLAFTEQYALYALARMLYTSRLIEGASLHHGAPLQHLDGAVLSELVQPAGLLLLISVLSALAREAGGVRDTDADSSAWHRVGRQLLDRFNDVVVMAAALAHAQALSRLVRITNPVLVLLAVLALSVVAEDSASVAKRRRLLWWRSLASVAALIGRYSIYALVQLLLLRYGYISTMLQNSDTILTVLVRALAAPLALVAFLVVARHLVGSVYAPS